MKELIAETGIGAYGRGSTGLFHERMGMYNLGWSWLCDLRGVDIRTDDWVDDGGYISEGRGETQGYGL